ncbi:MAG: hypothetical protein GX607_15975 [Myxococcales bacterium]|nr:hypothetical protein [Myxococcales bacterium]
MPQEAGPEPAPAGRPHLSTARRAGLVVVGLLAVALSVTCTVQIVLAVWFPAQGVPGASCRNGVLSLVAAVQRARDQAAAESPQGERAALGVFRRALDPEWQTLPDVRLACEGDDPARRALRTVELLRYAEERAVRYEALGLSPLRQRALALQRELGQSAESAPSSFGTAEEP